MRVASHVGYVGQVVSSTYMLSLSLDELHRLCMCVWKAQFMLTVAHTSYFILHTLHTRHTIILAIYSLFIAYV